MDELPFYVLIATASREHLLSRTLTSLSACHRPLGYRATIVVENGTKGKAEEIVTQFRDALSTRYLYVKEPNKSRALNEALSTLERGLVFFTDDDVRLHPATLCAYAEAARNETGGFFYGGPTDVDYDEPPPGWLLDYLPASAKGLSYGEEQMTLERFSGFPGINWAAFVSDLRRAGAFDPNFGPGSPTGSRGQETQMQRRLRDTGVEQVYVPEARVWHYVPRERCSAHWALRRQFQNGVEQGLSHDFEESGVRGVPPWVARLWLRRVVTAGKETLFGSREERFAAIHNLMYVSGIFRGMTLKPSASSQTDGSASRSAREENSVA